MDTQLTLVNNSNDANNSQVVIFQKNVARVDLAPVAWQVIKGLGPRSRHSFTLTSRFEVNCTDAWDNYTEQQTVDRPGMQFEMVLTPSGDVMREADPPIPYPDGAPSGTRFVNRLQPERTNFNPSVGAHAYKDGKRVATMTLDSQEEGGFEFVPSIYVGVASDAVEGAPLKPEVAWLIDDKFSLSGILKADIVMTGGGSGPNAPPLEFALARVVRMR